MEKWRNNLWDDLYGEEKNGIAEWGRKKFRLDGGKEIRRRGTDEMEKELKLGERRHHESEPEPELDRERQSEREAWHDARV